MVKGFHSSLWAKATTVERSQWREFLATLYSNTVAVAAAATAQGFEIEEEKYSNGTNLNTILNYKRNMDR